MDVMQRLELSEYKTIATINEAHHIELVQHQKTNRVYVKKILDVYNTSIYEYLKNHPIAGTPRIICCGEEDHQLILIEEYIQGESLREKMDAGALSLSALQKYVCALCDILKTLHSAQPAIIHRDIKPSNVLIDSNDQVVLIDFNASKFFTDKGSSDTVLLGTRGYAAPEQYGFGVSTPQTDIYAIGILMREALESLGLNRPELDAIISKCTEIDPKNRYKNVSAVQAAVLKTGKSQGGRDTRKPAESWRTVLPPGFRTLTPWKMLLAVGGYAFIFWISLSLEVEGETGFLLGANRLCCLMMMLFPVFIVFNYREMQKWMPLCRNENQAVRWIGVVLMSAIAIAILLFALVTLESWVRAR